MSTAEYEHDVYEDGQQFKDDAKLMVRFFMKAIKHEANSKAENRPVFVEVPHIEVITPGSRDTLVTEATENYQMRFRRQWDNFTARQTAPLEGTPLAEVPWMTVGQVAELNAMNVKTVEQLVNMPDVLAQKVMGSYQLRDRAKRFLEAAADGAAASKLEAQLEERDATIASQGQMIKQLQEQMSKLIKDTPEVAAAPAAKK